VLADTARVGGDDVAGALVDATDRLTNSVDTLLAVLNQLSDVWRVLLTR
jgi:hypothetical protein